MEAQSVSPEIISPEVKRILYDKFTEEVFLRTDLAYFAEKILGMEIVDHHKDWSRLCAKHKRICVNAARDHGKSYFWIFAYAIWRAYYNWVPLPKDGTFKSIPRVSLGYIWSNTQDQAIAHMTIIKTELLENPKLSHLVPPGKGPSGPEGWSMKQIKLANGAIIRASGWGSAVRGAHPVYGICDDVLNDETIYSELQRRKQIDYHLSAVTPMIIPGGQLVVVGTPFHASDLYAELKENPEYVFKRYPAIKEEDERALWPTRYPLENLKSKQREVGSVRFSREYLCVPVSDESSLFPERIISACYDDAFTMPKYLTETDLAQLDVFTGVDLALSATVGADYTVIFTIGIDEFKNIWVLNINRFKGKGMTEQLQAIEMVNSNFSPQRILVEDNAFQRVFRDELVKKTDMPVQGHTTTRKNKNNLETGIPALQILFENRKIIIPRAEKVDIEITDAFVNELRSFSWMDGKLQGVGAHDDTVMAFWIAIEAARGSMFSFSFA